MVQLDKKVKRKILKQFLEGKCTIKDIAQNYHTSQRSIVILLAKQLMMDLGRCLYGRKTSSLCDVDNNIEECPTELVSEKEEITATIHLDDSVDYGLKNPVFSAKRAEYEIIQKDIKSDFTKYDFSVIADITDQFLAGKKTISVLAEEYKVPQYVIFTWIIFCYEEVQNVAGRRARAVEEYDFMHLYSEKIKKVVAKASINCNLGLTNQDRIFGLGNGTLWLWKDQYGDSNIDDINLDDVAVALFLRRKLSATEKENRELHKEIKSLSLQNNMQVCSENSGF